jgi:predicted lipoprotein with Yx(FWY)xxD motif
MAHQSKILALALTCGFLAAGGASAAPDSGPPVTVRQTEEGPVWATASGMTLYTRKADNSAPGRSTCNEDRPTTNISSASEMLPIPAVDKRKTCTQKWPPLLADADAVSEGLWSIITRNDGRKQWAYEGHPLYTSIKDKRPGDVNGLGFFQRGAQGAGRLAFAPTGLPPGMKLLRLEEGLVLASMDGRPFYERRGAQRVCSGCGELLEPVVAPALGSQVGRDWSVVNIAGAKQYAFKGNALYVPPVEIDRTQIGRDWSLAVWRPTAGVPADIKTRWTVKAEVYTTKAGMTLYVFSCDQSGSDGLACDDPGDAAAYWSAVCGMDCLKRWRPYAAPANARPVGDWSVVDVAVPLFADATGVTLIASEAPSRISAWAYKGRPVFTYFEDEEPGQALGHAIKYPQAAGFYAIQIPGQDVDIE